MPPISHLCNVRQCFARKLTLSPLLLILNRVCEVSASASAGSVPPKRVAPGDDERPPTLNTEVRGGVCAPARLALQGRCRR
jgi:hypothetical protein